MRNSVYAVACGLALLGAAGAQQAASPAETPWSLNGTIIEACSCPMFCQCFFNHKPAAGAAHAGHEGGQFCLFNNAFKVNRGRYGDVSLDGAKFWVAGDLGGDFSMGRMDWAVLHFDTSVKKEQRDGIAAVLAKLYPVKWNSFQVRDDYPIEWSYTRDRAVARLDGGKAAEIILKRLPGNTDAPVVIRNLKYWGAPRNDGLLLMPNEIEAYRLGEKKYEFNGSNGFMVTVDLASRDFQK